MKKSICLYFQVHQPNRLRLYRFFDIGKDSHYYDDFANRTILRRVAQKCYLPMVSGDPQDLPDPDHYAVGAWRGIR